MGYEIFRQCDAETVCTVRFLWLAKLITFLFLDFDYAKPGQGWDLSFRVESAGIMENGKFTSVLVKM